MEACRAEGVKPFFYHTTLDWMEEDFEKTLTDIWITFGSLSRFSARNTVRSEATGLTVTGAGRMLSAARLTISA